MRLGPFSLSIPYHCYTAVMFPLSLLLLSVPLVAAQFVPAPTNLTQKIGYANVPVRYKEVPAGICELNSSVKSYSGYVDVAENEHYFFWFFEARNVDPSTAPLTVWINGGPGSSSMIGLFQELGPCRIDEDGNVVDNPYAWNNVSNVVFIDQPAQVGHSYSQAISAYQDPSTGYIVQLPNATCPDYALDLGTCGTYSYSNESLTANSTANAAPHFWRSLQGLLGAFPKYSRHGFNFATESYGGHYGPIFNAYIESQNKLIANGSLPDAHHIKLETVLIGNGWYDPLIQYEAYYNFTVFPGNTYDYKPFNQSISNQMYNAMFGPGNCRDQTRDCYARGINSICSAADNFCYSEVENVLDVIANRDEYDIRELSPDPFPESYFEAYLNTPKVQQAIGAYVNFSSSSSAVSSAFGNTGDDDRESGTIAAVQGLVAQGVTVILYAGDADYNCKHPSFLFLLFIPSLVQLYATILNETPKQATGSEAKSSQPKSTPQASPAPATPTSAPRTPPSTAKSSNRQTLLLHASTSRATKYRITNPSPRSSSSTAPSAAGISRPERARSGAAIAPSAPRRVPTARETPPCSSRLWILRRRIIPRLGRRMRWVMERKRRRGGWRGV